MVGHDIIVIGASAGGVEACIALVRKLPANLPAAIFVVVHIPATTTSLLPALLSQAGALPAQHPVTGTLIERGQIYVAPPDHHLLVERGHLHVLRGPKENGFRPAIDATLRTAAQAYGPRVVGTVLTGMLDDGTAGLRAVKRRGGTAVVQHPDDAAFPSMPRNALRYVNVDVVETLANLPAALVRLAHTLADITEEEAMLEGQNDARRAAPADQEPPAPQGMKNTPFSCPDCSGVLMEYYDGDLLRFRCQVGHVFSRESALESQSDTLDQTIWAAYRALNERADLARRLTHDAQVLGDEQGEHRFAQLAAQAEQQKEQLHQLMLGEARSGNAA